jgi:hypothetical protein
MINTILKRVGPTDKLIAARLGCNLHQVKDWRRRGRIPSAWWARLSAASDVTLRELAELHSAQVVS